MIEKLNIRELLKGTRFEERADVIAKQIEGWGMDNSYDINNLPIHGRVGGESPSVLVRLILDQHEKAAEVDEPEIVEPEVPEEPAEIVYDEPDWLKASPAALKIAEEEGIDLSTVTGTGVSGTIVKSDIENLLNVEEDEHDN